LGLDWHLGDTFAISPFVGYQFMSASNFTSTVSSTSGTASSGQTVQLSVIPTADGKVITPTTGGNLVVPVVTSAGVLLPGSTAPAGTAPATVDLGGLNVGVQISIFF
jgi:hypothetical protein